MSHLAGKERSLLHVTTAPWRNFTSDLLLLIPVTPVPLLTCASPRWCCAVCQEMVQMCCCSARVMNSVFKYANEVMKSPKQVLFITVCVSDNRQNMIPVQVSYPCQLCVLGVGCWVLCMEHGDRSTLPGLPQACLLWELAGALWWGEEKEAKEIQSKLEMGFCRVLCAFVQHFASREKHWTAWQCLSFLSAAGSTGPFPQAGNMTCKVNSLFYILSPHSATHKLRSLLLCWHCWEELHVKFGF